MSAEYQEAFPNAKSCSTMEQVASEGGGLSFAANICTELGILPDRDALIVD